MHNPNPPLPKQFSSWDEYYKTAIDCAAILAPDGLIWTGKRHGHCIKTIVQATGNRVGSDFTQGFVTMSGRFVSRKEAAELALNAGQIKEQVSCLFSEDLY